MFQPNRLIVAAFALVTLTACEDCDTPPVKTYRELPRNVSQLRQDRLYSVIMRTSTISNGGSNASDGQVQVVGSLSLAEGHSPETAMPALITALARTESGDTVTQREIINAMGNTRSDLAIPSLAHHLAQTGDRSAEGNASPGDTAVLNSPVRTEAAVALGQVAHKAGVKPLIDALLDSELSVRQAAASALRIITNQEKGFEADGSFESRVIAQTNWEAWWNDNRDSNRLDWLLEGFRQKDVSLEDPGSTEGIVALVSALEKGEDFIRLNAADLINQIRYEDAESRNAANKRLLPLLDHELEGVRRTAVMTMIRINGLAGYLPNEDGVATLERSIQYLPTTDADGSRLPEVIAHVKKWWQNGAGSGAQPDEGASEE